MSIITRYRSAKDSIHFYLLLAIIITTIFSWFNLNSICIITLMALLILEGKIISPVKKAFSNKLFLAFVALYLVEGAGLLYTNNLDTGWSHVESKATLVAIPFILCAGTFTDLKGYKKIMTAYCLIIFITTLYCLAVAFNNYSINKDIDVFFYNDLMAVIDQNAILFSIYVLFGLLFLLTSGLYGNIPGPQTKKALRLILIFYLIGFIILLASKLMLFILAIILAIFFLRTVSFQKNKAAFLLFIILCVATLVVLVVTNNPIKKRYLDITGDNFSVLEQDRFTPVTDFNGVSLRLLEWRYAIEILNENNAWITGTSPGDSQDLLDQKYIDANMYIGIPGTDQKGYLGYNFHNQYIQYLVQSGIIGLVVLLFVCFLLVRLSKRAGTFNAFSTVLILLTVFFTESILELQHGLFLFTFFPFMLLYSRKIPEKRFDVFHFPGKKPE